MSLQDILEVVPRDSDELSLVHAIDFARLPRHVAIIMDGNGRWANIRHKQRVEGHRAGIASVRDVVETSARLGLEVLTLYAFSRENWKRPPSEVSTLMGLLKLYIRKELGTLLQNNIRFQIIGRPEELADDVRKELEKGVERTAGMTGMIFNIALNYGARTEIADGVKRLVQDALAGRRSVESIDEQVLSSYMYTAGQPDPDLLIRTSGEMRISNFLLWQIAYSEIWVTDVLWPDFRRRHLLQAIADFQKRDRRYGGIKSA
jgi:undecaprenyl diphosphate synthase